VVTCHQGRTVPTIGGLISAAPDSVSSVRRMQRYWLPGAVGTTMRRKYHASTTCSGDSTGSADGKTRVFVIRRTKQILRTISSSSRNAAFAGLVAEAF